MPLSHISGSTRIVSLAHPDLRQQYFNGVLLHAPEHWWNPASICRRLASTLLTWSLVVRVGNLPSGPALHYLQSSPVLPGSHRYSWQASLKATSCELRTNPLYTQVYIGSGSPPPETTWIPSTMHRYEPCMYLLGNLPIPG